MKLFRAPNPSAIARALATDYWGKIDDEQCITRGVYEFGTPGHGGLIAVLGQVTWPAAQGTNAPMITDADRIAPVSSTCITAGLSVGFGEQQAPMFDRVVVTPTAWQSDRTNSSYTRYLGRRLFLNPGPETLDSLHRQAPEGMPILHYACLVGEEDVYWALVLGVSTAILDAYNRARAKRHGRALTMTQDVEGTLRRWEGARLRYRQLTGIELSAEQEVSTL